MINWKYFGRVHKLLYKLSGGKYGARMGWIDVALVTATGRKSGKQRTVPIACYPYRDSVAVSASNSGMESDPAWYLNMQANPRVTVQLGKEQFKAMAEDVPDEERKALWESVVKINKHQSEYLAAVQREIPLIWFRRLQDN
jgi:deazaflavin-dependent oxidoreductase (nitroreductase family)